LFVADLAAADPAAADPAGLVLAGFGTGTAELAGGDSAGASGV
jgi:hypothetical protein